MDVVDGDNTRLVITLHDVLFAIPEAFSGRNWNVDAVKPIQHTRWLLESARHVTAPSRFISDFANRYLEVQTIVIPNGIDMPSLEPWDDTVEVKVGEKRYLHRIAVLGAIGRHKGGEIIFEIAAALPDDIVIIVIGFLDGQLETGWASEHHCLLASHPGAGRIFVTGPYAPSDLRALFDHYRPQLVLFPGKVPESFSYALSEVWVLGGIPVVPQLGALGERTDRNCAVRYNSTTNISDLAKLLVNWCGEAAAEQRDRLKLFIRQNLHQLVPTLIDMAKAFNDLYREMSQNSQPISDARVLDKFSTLCEMNLDPAQFRTELRLMIEQIDELRATDSERQRWNDQLELAISELKARNLEVEAQLVNLAEHSRSQLIIHEQEKVILEQEIMALKHSNQIARIFLGEDESDWIRNGRVARLAKRVPGLIEFFDWLAALRKR